MKPMFRCEYCNFTGTEEEVGKHEEECLENYTKRSCWTCQHRCLQRLTDIKCEVGRDIPSGNMITFCPQYERKEKKVMSNDLMSNLFGGLSL